MSYNHLTPEESEVIEQKATEAPFTGIYDDFFQEGTYICKKCNAPLFDSRDKFNSGCGWPAFDDSVASNIKTLPDGNRTEIQCAQCHAHLGHVFEGEQLTQKNTRHCVNSLSIRFVPKEHIKPEQHYER